MKGIVKGLIWGGVIALVGVIIILITLGVNGWQIGSTKFTMNNFTAQNENTALEIGINDGTLKTEFYDGDKVIIDYPTSDGLEARIIEENGKIIFVSDLKWYKSFFAGCRRIPETIIKLPKDVIFEISCKMNAGTIVLADGNYSNVNLDINAGTFKTNSISCASFTGEMSAGTLSISEAVCNSMNCDLSAGTMNVNRLTCANTKIDISAGTVKLAFTGEQREYAIYTDISAGSCNVGSQAGETDKRIDIDVSAGTVKINFGA